MARFPVSGNGLASETEPAKLSASELPASVVSDASPHGATAGKSLVFNGSVFVVDDRPPDVYNTQTNPAGVTDWGPIISAITHPQPYFGPQQFPFSTTITFPNPAVSKVWKGAGGWNNGLPASNLAATRLIWKGAHGRAIDYANTQGLHIQDLGVEWDHTTGYDGDLIGNSGGNVPNPVLERCMVCSDNRTATSAHSLVSFDATGNGAQLIECCLIGATYLVSGFETGHYADGIRLDRCTFFTAATAALRNFGQGCRIVGCTFEAEYPYLYLNDAISADVTSHLTFENCNVSDTVGFVSMIKVDGPGVGQPHYIVLNHSPIVAGSGTLIDLASSGGLEMMGNVIQSHNGAPIVDLHAFNDPNNIKNPVTIIGNNISANDQADVIVNRDGHRNINIFGNGGGGKIREQRARGGVEFVNYSNNFVGPGIAAHAGTGNGAWIYGSDTKGWVLLSIDAGGGVAGLQADITFSAPLATPPDYPFGGAGRYPIPHVHLTPIELPDIWPGSIGPGNNAAGLGEYAQLPNNLSGWKLGCKTAPPAGKALQFLYNIEVVG